MNGGSSRAATIINGAVTDREHALLEWNSGGYWVLMRPPSVPIVLYPNRPLHIGVRLAMLHDIYVQPSASTKGTCLPIHIQFDMPAPHYCVALVWPRKKLIEYFDPNASVEGQYSMPRRWESVFRNVCEAKWKYTFRGTEEIYGPTRTYSVGGGPVKDRIFPPPQRAARRFMKRLKRERASQRNGKIPLDKSLEEFLACVEEQGDGIVNLFWCKHVVEEATVEGVDIATFIKTRDWYEGAVDYLTIGARVLKYFIRAVEESVMRCQRYFEHFPDMGILV